LKKYLHIVCLDVPYPPDYGGVFDLYYKLRYLKERDIKIILHCFEYGRGRQPALNNYCEQVYYYKRKRGIRSLSLTVPYIVTSRNDSTLLENLSRDNYPVLLEGTHCTLLLWKNALPNRKVILRLHNIESDYYRLMAKKTNSFFRKLYYWNEGMLLKRYEYAVAQRANMVLTVSEKDALHLKQVHGIKQVNYLPVFTGWNGISCKEGTGDYCLYHGNLSVAENEAAALWLTSSVFSGLSIPLKIAGKNPSKKLIAAIQAYLHIEIIPNPEEATMEKLIRDAQINLLPSFSSTGIKLKLLHALFCGRHCIANEAMAGGTPLENACKMAENAASFQSSIQLLYTRPFTKEDIMLRQNILEQQFNNRRNAEQLIQWIWSSDPIQ
jgi:glycosyltransferase involved in cell wall biosynthesis